MTHQYLWSENTGWKIVHFKNVSTFRTQNSILVSWETDQHVLCESYRKSFPAVSPRHILFNFFLFQILNWFLCISIYISNLFYSRDSVGEARISGISGCNLFCTQQIGKYLAFLWRPSISTHSGKIHLSKQFKQMPLIRYLSHHCLTSQFVIFPFRTLCPKIALHDSEQHNLKENTQRVRNDDAISAIKADLFDESDYRLSLQCDN